MNNNISCPVDFIPVNENKIRLVAAFVLLLTLLYLITDWWLIIAFMVIDFFFRSFKLNQYSLLGIVADSIVKLVKIKNKPTDQAPKRFSARVGLVFTLATFICSLLQFTTASIGLAAVLCAFAFMESCLSFCAGCYVYGYYHKWFGKQQSSINV